MRGSTAVDGNVAVDDSINHLLSSACVIDSDPEIDAKEDPKKILLRVPPTLKSAWDSMCEKRKISQTDAGLALIEWITSQRPEIQAMVMGQIPATPDLIALVLRRLADAGAGDDAQARRHAATYGDTTRIGEVTPPDGPGPSAHPPKSGQQGKHRKPR